MDKPGDLDNLGADCEPVTLQLKDLLDALELLPGMGIYANCMVDGLVDVWSGMGVGLSFSDCQLVSVDLKQ